MQMSTGCRNKSHIVDIGGAARARDLIDNLLRGQATTETTLESVSVEVDEAAVKMHLMSTCSEFDCFLTAEWIMTNVADLRSIPSVSPLCAASHLRAASPAAPVSISPDQGSLLNVVKHVALTATEGPQQYDSSPCDNLKVVTLARSFQIFAKAKQQQLLGNFRRWHEY